MYMYDPIRDERNSMLTIDYRSRPYWGAPLDHSVSVPMPSRVYRHQYGWRGPRGLDNIDPANSDAIPSSGTWGSASGYANGISRLERASTPNPMVRDPSLPVHYRELYSLQLAPGVTFGGPIYSGHPYPHQFTEAFMALGWKTDDMAVYGPPSLSESEIDANASRLSERILATRPTRPDFSLARAVLELRDFPRLMAHIASIRNSGVQAGSSYLSFQFGYAPIVADLRKCALAILNADSKIRQFVRDSGRLVSRSVNLTDRTSSEAPSSSLVWGFTSLEHRSFYLEKGDFRLETTESTNTRAFALWEYYASDHGGALAVHQSAVKKADHFLGLKVTPQVLWQITPWTWMIDWFLNISNLLGYQQEVSDHSLAMRRSGYIVEKQRTWTAVQDFRVSNGAGVKTPWMQVACTAKSTTHVRRPGLSPYGLVKPWDGLNPFQISIAAALGLQRRGI